MSDDDYYEMQNRLSPEKFPDWTGLRSQEWFLRAQELAAAKRFFHWELEFPEAFQEESRGFDVVIGNPPYGTGRDWDDSTSVDQLKMYLHENYTSASYQLDSYPLFIERAVQRCSIVRSWG